ncbi:hypothetical protein REIS_0601 [Rickettsia endosymbiont of Ixodes scapularis]|nr:hypothetical protein REIS_0601 [Rickettsia endosymbiont of Ixodes scapularis]
MRIALLAVKTWHLEFWVKLNIVLEPREYIGFLGIKYLIMIKLLSLF